MSQGLTNVALLGFTGAVLHVLNHACFKGLLFLGAGSVLHATGERNIDRLGGLLKRMPFTGITFVIGAAAISGLPPLNGFVSEFFIFLGALQGAIASNAGTVFALLAVVAGLGLIGGLAVACFAKVVGIVFLGSARTEKAAHAHDGEAGLLAPMVALAGLCVFIGVASVVAARVALPVAAQLTGVELSIAKTEIASFSSPLGDALVVMLVVVGLIGALGLLRWWLLVRRRVESAVTWDCGYEKPSARMQYTASSFAQPLVAVFRQVLQPKERLHQPQGYFPEEASYHSTVPDVFTERGYGPILNAIEWSSSRLRWLQQGRVHLYLLYIFITLVILLVWRLAL